MRYILKKYLLCLEAPQWKSILSSVLCTGWKRRCGRCCRTRAASWSRALWTRRTSWRPTRWATFLLWKTFLGAQSSPSIWFENTNIFQRISLTSSAILAAAFCNRAHIRACGSLSVNNVTTLYFEKDQCFFVFFNFLLYKPSHIKFTIWKECYI